MYDGRSFADDNATLASIRRGESIGGEFSPRKNTKVGNLEDKIKELFGLKTQIAGSDNSYLCDNKITLAKAKEDDDARMERKARKASRIKIKNEIENTDEEEFGLLNEDDDTNFYGECENTVKTAIDSYNQPTKQEQPSEESSEESCEPSQLLSDNISKYGMYAAFQ